MADGKGLLLLFIIVNFSLFELDALSGNHLCDDRCCSDYQEVDGKCVECPPGSFGVNCSNPCIENYYGLFCRSVCNCTSNQTCNPVNGECYIDSEDVTQEDVGEKRFDLNYIIPVAVGGGGGGGVLICITIAGLCYYCRCYRKSRRQITRLNNTCDLQSNDRQEAHYMEIRSSQIINSLGPQVDNNFSDYDCASQGPRTCYNLLTEASNFAYDRIQACSSEYNMLSFRNSASDIKTIDNTYDEANFTDIKTKSKSSVDELDQHKYFLLEATSTSKHYHHTKDSEDSGQSGGGIKAPSGVRVAKPNIKGCKIKDKNETDIKMKCKSSLDDQDQHKYFLLESTSNGKHHHNTKDSIQSGHCIKAPPCVFIAKQNTKGGNSNGENDTKIEINPHQRGGKDKGSSTDICNVPVEGEYSLSKGNNCDKSRGRVYSFARSPKEEKDEA